MATALLFNDSNQSWGLTVNTSKTKVNKGDRQLLLLINPILLHTINAHNYGAEIIGNHECKEIEIIGHIR